MDSLSDPFPGPEHSPRHRFDLPGPAAAIAIILLRRGQPGFNPGLMQLWREVAGPFVSDHTTAVGVKEGVLIVHVPAANLRAELRVKWADEILSKLQAILGADQIRAIEFHETVLLGQF